MNSYVVILRVDEPVSIAWREQLTDVVIHDRSEGNMDGCGFWYEREDVMNDR